MYNQEYIIIDYTQINVFYKHNLYMLGSIIFKPLSEAATELFSCPSLRSAIVGVLEHMEARPCRLQ